MRRFLPWLAGIAIWAGIAVVVFVVLCDDDDGGNSTTSYEVPAEPHGSGAT